MISVIFDLLVNFVHPWGFAFHSYLIFLNPYSRENLRNRREILELVQPCDRFLLFEWDFWRRMKMDWNINLHVLVHKIALKLDAWMRNVYHWKHGRPVTVSRCDFLLASGNLFDWKLIVSLFFRWNVCIFIFWRILFPIILDSTRIVASHVGIVAESSTIRFSTSSANWVGQHTYEPRCDIHSERRSTWLCSSDSDHFLLRQIRLYRFTKLAELSQTIGWD